MSEEPVDFAARLRRKRIQQQLIQRVVGVPAQHGDVDTSDSAAVEAPTPASPVQEGEDG